MRALAIVVLCTGLGACGASTSQQASTAKKPAPAPKAAEAPAPPPAAAVAAAPAPPTELPANYDAGEIRREKLLSVLNAGPGRFLQRVRVKKADDPQGRFAGWRIVELFPGEADAASVLVPGDIVVRVNGQSVERPEQFNTVWDSLALSSELVVTVRRGATQSDVRYRIVTEQLPP
jgi:type II secretory pathway component PulC